MEIMVHRLDESGAESLNDPASIADPNLRFLNSNQVRSDHLHLLTLLVKLKAQGLRSRRNMLDLQAASMYWLVRVNLRAATNLPNIFKCLSTSKILRDLDAARAKKILSTECKEHLKIFNQLYQQTTLGRGESSASHTFSAASAYPHLLSGVVFLILYLLKVSAVNTEGFSRRAPVNPNLRLYMFVLDDGRDILCSSTTSLPRSTRIPCCVCNRSTILQAGKSIDEEHILRSRNHCSCFFVRFNHTLSRRIRCFIAFIQRKSKISYVLFLSDADQNTYKSGNSIYYDD